MSYTTLLWIAANLNDVLAIKGENILKNKKLNTDIDDSVNYVLLSPSKRCGILGLQDKLTKLKEKGIKILSQSVASKILKNYSWVPCVDLQHNPWTKEKLDNFYEHLLVEQKSKTTFKDAVCKANLTKNEVVLFKSIKEVAYIKDMRDYYRRKGICYILPFFDELGCRLGMNRKDVVYLTHDEIISSLKGEDKISQDIINERRKNFLMYWDDNKILTSVDKQEIEKFKHNFVLEKITEIKGVIASRGIIEGKVKVVKVARDLKKINKGDILIAIATHPDYVIAMQQASAFVTDEGGLTSHVAIVARELKKPCIIGTKIATQVLKDGDLVEVDANSGIVRIIKTNY